MSEINTIMANIGFLETDNGPYVTELRDMLANKGMNNMGISWGPRADQMSAEDRAKSLLSVEWGIRRGHSHCVYDLDARIDWRSLPSRLKMYLCIWRDRLFFPNPYA